MPVSVSAPAASRAPSGENASAVSACPAGLRRCRNWRPLCGSQQTAVQPAAYASSAGEPVENARLALSGLDRPVTRCNCSGGACAGRPKGERVHARMRRPCRASPWHEGSLLGLRLWRGRASCADLARPPRPPAAVLNSRQRTVVGDAALRILDSPLGLTRAGTTGTTRACALVAAEERGQAAGSRATGPRRDAAAQGQGHAQGQIDWVAGAGSQRGARAPANETAAFPGPICNVTHAPAFRCCAQVEQVRLHNGYARDARWRCGADPSTWGCARHSTQVGRPARVPLISSPCRSGTRGASSSPARSQVASA